MFTNSGRDRQGYADQGAPRKPYCNELPAMSQDARDWTAFRQFMRDRGIDPQIATLNAWYPSTAAGDDYLRVVIPGTSREPANQFWQARLIETGDCDGDMGDARPPRYQSPTAKRGDAVIVTHPDYSLTGNDHKPVVVLVEGPFDALAASEVGMVGVALMGNTPSEDALDHAVGWLRDGVRAVFVTDEDAVVQGADLGWRLLAQHGLKSLLILSPYPYKDLAEMPKPDRERLFREGGIKT